MPDCVDTLMDPVQSSRRHALVDDLHMESQVLQLPKRHHPVLLFSKAGNSPIGPTSRPTGRFLSIKGYFRPVGRGSVCDAHGQRSVAGESALVVRTV